jgi:hypothetical protein
VLAQSISHPSHLLQRSTKKSLRWRDRPATPRTIRRPPRTPCSGRIASHPSSNRNNKNRHRSHPSSNRNNKNRHRSHPQHLVTPSTPLGTPPRRRSVLDNNSNRNRVIERKKTGNNKDEYICKNFTKYILRTRNIIHSLQFQVHQYRKYR